MFRRSSTPMRWAVGLAVGAVVTAVGAPTAGAADAPVTTISGTATIAGSTPAAGLSISVYTRLVPGGPSVDEHRTTVAADGTYSLNLAYATGYYSHIEPDATPARPVIDTSYTAVPSTTWTYAGGGGTGAYSSLNCDPSPELAQVYRFWSPVFNNAHFFTTNADEAQNIRDNDKNWVDEGGAFTAVSTNADGSCATGLPVFRFYSPVFQSHFYTQNADEKAHIVAADHNWSYEGVAYCAFPEARTGTVALYRFWSPVFGKHFFTADEGEKNHIVASDHNWSYEGVAYYVAP